MLEKCRLEEHVMQNGVPLQGSSRGYDPIQLILGLFASVWCGASYFGHLDVVCYDIVLCDLLGRRRGTDHRAYQRYLNRFSQAVNQRAFRNLFRWFFSELKFDNYTSNFDSTMMVREGNQGGAAKRYNPKRPGQLSYHPLFAFVSGVRVIANYWPRPGDTPASTNYLSFLGDTLPILEGKRVGLIRMGSGFFVKEIPDYLENKRLHHIIACRLSNRTRYSLTHGRKQTELTGGLEISETICQVNSWERPRHIAMVRQEIERRPEAAGRQIKQMDLFEDEEDFGKYQYSCFVADLNLPTKIVCDSYHGRVDSKNRAKELKNDFSTDDFVIRNLWATEIYGSFIVMTYNFMSLFRHTLINSDRKKFLKIIRYELLSTPVYLGRAKDRHILYLAKSLKTR